MGILQARILEWESSQPRDWTQVSCITGGFFTVWPTREALKKAEYRRIDAFQLRCWRRLLRVPWTTRRSNQSFLKKKINPEYSLGGLMLKLKLQYFGRLIWRATSLEKTLMLGKTEGKSRRGAAEDEMVRQHYWLSGQEFEQTLGDSRGQRSLACCSPWDLKESNTT